MRDAVAAIQSLLAPVLPSHWMRVERTLTRADYPYALIWQSTGRSFREEPLDGGNETVDALLGVTVVGLTVAQAETKARAVRGVLFPGGRPRDLDVPGRVTQIEWQAFSVMQEDRDAPLTDLGLPGYPVIHVDLYRLVSYPTDPSCEPAVDVDLVP